MSNLSSEFIDFRLRGMADEELDALLQRLEDQVRSMSQATTSLGQKLAAQYRDALTRVRLERDRRCAD